MIANTLPTFINSIANVHPLAGKNNKAILSAIPKRHQLIYNSTSNTTPVTASSSDIKTTGVIAQTPSTYYELYNSMTVKNVEPTTTTKAYGGLLDEWGWDDY